MATLQVKGMDNQLYDSLKRRAELDHRSISQEVISIIQTFLSQPTKKNENATYEFLKLSGSWPGNETAEEIIKDIYSNRKQKRKTPDFDNVFN
ncbi:hypothetical protein MNBD_UNCLBAC01-1270 [hydrothermal vent metagenome]|uniref:Arc-like DNA binding domain-containing protein n=1 Tax=hydrothermal vent metagenome TaxID=652676 RepID=A0A3B1D1I9_9ZZZZ